MYAFSVTEFCFAFCSFNKQNVFLCSVNKKKPEIYLVIVKFAQKKKLKKGADDYLT